MNEKIKNYFQIEETPPTRVHVGMRMIKTMCAMLICGLVDWVLDLSPLFAMIAALMSMQRNMEKTMTAALNRILATLIGGVFGLGVLFIGLQTGAIQNGLFYYPLVALMIIPLIVLTVLIRKSTLSGLTGVAMICVSVLSGTDGAVYTYAFDRIFQTGMGVIVAVLVNLALPPYGKQDGQGESAPPPLPGTLPEEEKTEGP